MKTYHFQNLDNSLDVEVITDGIKDQKEFTVTEWPPRGYNGDVEALGMDWNVGPINEEKFVEFAKENNLTLTAIGENGSESLVTAELPVAPTTTPVAPIDGQDNVSRVDSSYVNVSWNAVPDATKYLVKMWKSAETPESGYSGETTQAWDAISAEPSTEYKWQVTTQVPNMQDSISGPWTFTTADDTGSSN